MLTADDLTNAGIVIKGDDLYSLAAVEWIAKNTNIPAATPEDVAAFDNSTKLFIQQYVKVMKCNPGVASESIEGMSRSFSNGSDKSSLIWDIANSPLGDAVSSQVTFTAATERWTYAG